MMVEKIIRDLFDELETKGDVVYGEPFSLSHISLPSSPIKRCVWTELPTDVRDFLKDKCGYGELDVDTDTIITSTKK